MRVHIASVYGDGPNLSQSDQQLVALPRGAPGVMKRVEQDTTYGPLVGIGQLNCLKKVVLQFNHGKWRTKL